MNSAPRPAKTDDDPRIVEALRIKERLALRGIALVHVDRTYKLPTGIARITLREPNKAGEAAISAALDVPAHELWPSRYLPTGQRKSPQDYDRPPTMRQRRKASERQS